MDIKQMSTKERILDFISNFRGAEQVFMNGMCYWFAAMLNSRFCILCGRIIYDAVRGHFMFLYDDVAYDAEGAHEAPDGYYYWDNMRNGDYEWYMRITNECVLKIK